VSFFKRQNPQQTSYKGCRMLPHVLLLSTVPASLSRRSVTTFTQWTTLVGCSGACRCCDVQVCSVLMFKVQSTWQTSVF